MSLQSLLKSHFFFRSMQEEESHLKHVVEVGVGDGVGRPSKEMANHYVGNELFAS